MAIKKGKTFSQGVSVLDEKEIRYHKCHNAVCHMPAISADTTTREDNTT